MAQWPDLKTSMRILHPHHKSLWMRIYSGLPHRQYALKVSTRVIHMNLLPLIPGPIDFTPLKLFLHRLSLFATVCNWRRKAGSFITTSRSCSYCICLQYTVLITKILICIHDIHSTVSSHMFSLVMEHTHTCSSRKVQASVSMHFLQSLTSKSVLNPACIQTEYLENTEKHSLCPPKEKWTLPRKLYYINEWT
jgi:hypothetical protein